MSAYELNGHELAAKYLATRGDTRRTSDGGMFESGTPGFSSGTHASTSSLETPFDCDDRTRAVSSGSSFGAPAIMPSTVAVVRDLNSGMKHPSRPKRMKSR